MNTKGTNVNTTVELAKEVWSETALAEVLGVTGKQLRRMILEDNAPGIRLERGKYVFMARDVLNWLETKKSGRGCGVNESEKALTAP